MEPDLQKIIEKTRHLSRLIDEHEISQRYHESREKMIADRKAQELYGKLVVLGSGINRQVSSGGQYRPEQSQENEMLQQEIQENDLVREFIIAQKEYLDLIMKVADRIKNPVPE